MSLIDAPGISLGTPESPYLVPHRSTWDKEVGKQVPGKLGSPPGIGGRLPVASRLPAPLHESRIVSTPKLPNLPGDPAFPRRNDTKHARRRTLATDRNAHCKNGRRVALHIVAPARGALPAC